MEQTIQEVQKIYQRNYFPEMNVSWHKFPNNIGHLYSPDTFVVTTESMLVKMGKLFLKTCSICHTILSEQFGNEKPELSLTGVGYRHPVDIGNSWKDDLCSDCHGQ